MKIDVIIPVYKPEDSFLEVLERLENQTIPIQNIILMNTEEKYYEKLIYGKRFIEKYHNIKVKHLSKREFDHGKTRKQGVLLSDADIFIMMTQDALPVNELLIENLIRPLMEDRVATSYARQIPYNDCNIIEKAETRWKALHQRQHQKTQTRLNFLRRRQPSAH